MSVCANCGKENQVHYKYCLGCGAELSGDPAAPASSSAKPTAEAKPAEPRSIPRTVLAEEGAVANTKDDGMLGAIAEALSSGDQGESGWGTNGEPEPAGGFTDESSTTAAGLSDAQARDEAAIRAAGGRDCPTCGNLVSVDFAFCGQCGTRLEARAAPSTRPPVGAQSQGAARGRMVLVRPDGSEGGTHNLEEGENIIGRGAGTLFDADGYLSPRHAELVLNAAGLVVRDAGSLNGVFVKLTVEEELVDGDVFRIGQELLRFDEIRAPEPLEDGTEVLGSPNPGYWGRLAVIVGREQDGSAFPLFGDAVVLGRERGDLVFPEDGYVSGTHARVAFRDGRYYLCDMNSSNGTFLRLRSEREIPSGGFLLMGQQLFRIVYT
jgi:pSer/pThr/pTyr-binding forkhead associated (FHA) protein